MSDTCDDHAAPRCTDRAVDDDVTGRVGAQPFWFEPDRSADSAAGRLSLG